MTDFKEKNDIDPAAILEAAAESILVTSADLDHPGPTIVYVNPAFERMTGWTGKEVRGKSPRMFQGPNTDLRIFEDLRERLLANGLWEGKTINYRKDGSEFWMEWSIVPLKSDAGDVIQYVAIQRNVSARVVADQRLLEALAAERVAERARSNLARYFSPKIVETLVKKDQPLGAVRRQDLAVLFADIVGFTGLSETLEPEQVMELLREIHGWMEEVIFRCEGSIEGYIGDAVLAIFGFPESGQQDAGNALSCAYQLLKAAENWNDERSRKGLSAIEIGIGLHYGPVVLGDVGTVEYVDFTVIGDTVNIASRLQQATRQLDSLLVVGRELIDAVKDENSMKDSDNLLKPLQSQGDLAIRGRRQAVEIWTLSSESK
ncbi:MAG: PAS domain S-box protein [Rhizobiaceae bacterium]|nr:PAS domain S-box protein [Rhizobiaceae bacterium]